MLAAGALGVPPTKRRPRSLVLKGEISTQHGKHEVTALVDTGGEEIFVSQSFIKTARIPEPEHAPTMVRAIDGHKIPSYGIHDLVFSLADSRGKKQERTLKAYAVDMRGYDLILGYPWIHDVDPDIHWREQYWTYRDPPKEPARLVDIALVDAEQFATLANAAITRNEGEAYIAMPYQILSQGDGVSCDKAVRCGATQLDDPVVPKQLECLSEVFSEELSDSLNTHDQVEHPIDLLPGKLPRGGPIYNMSHDELAAIRDYLKSALEKDWIRPSSSQVGSPVLFVKKADGSLRLCVDYRGLNEVTVKNNYPLPLLSETLERFAHAKHFTKIDIRNAYHRIRVRKGDEWKTAFRTRYGQFEYQVMPFGLANAPATFQGYVNKALKPYIDVFCVVYLDDVLVYSESEELHWEHVRKVLRALLEHRLYAKLSKCAFNRDEVTFLGFIVNRRGIQMEQSRIEAITKWPEPESARDVLVFLGFAGFYRRFVKGFSQIAAPLTDLTKGAKKGQARPPFVFGKEAREAFETLKRVFTTAPVLEHYDWEAALVMETDASDAGAGGVLSQLGKDNQWHPIAFSSYKFKGPETRWDTHDKELYAIVRGFKNWRHYLQGSKHPIRVISDHNNLRYFMTTKELNAKQIRWAEKLAAFDFTIEYRKGKLNPADAPSRRPDIVKPDSSEENNDSFLPTLRNKLRNQEYQPDLQGRDGVPAIVKLAALTAQLGSTATLDTQVTNLDEEVLERRTCILDTAMSSRLLVHQVLESERSYLELREPMVAWLLKLQRKDAWVVNEEWRQRYAGKQDELSKWGVGEDGLLRRGLAVYVPNDPATKEEILQANHDDPSAGHFAKKRTEEGIRSKYYWPGMVSEIANYVRTCPECQRVRVHHHKPYGELSSIPPGGVAPFHTVTMDFITDMPPARDPYTGKTCDAILVLVDKLTKHATYIATTMDLKADGLADIMWREFVSLRGMMRNLISDRGSLFTSKFWTTLCWHLGAKRKLSTAFHPQTDGQTERQNQVLEHYLRVYCNYKQDNWPEILPMAAFAYNNSVHASTNKTPQELLMGYLADLGNAPEDRTLRGEAPLATERAEWLRSTRSHLQELWEKVSKQQAKSYNSSHKAVTFQVGDKVLLRSVNIRTLRPKKKLDHRQLGPFQIIEKKGTQAYKLDLPAKYGRIHPVFHISLLEPWYSRGVDPEPQSVLIDDEEEWEINEVRDKRVRNGAPEYLISWKDSHPYEDSWEPMEHLGNARGAIKDFERTRESHKPAPKGKQKSQSLQGIKKRGRPRKVK